MVGVAQGRGVGVVRLAVQRDPVQDRVVKGQFQHVGGLSVAVQTEHAVGEVHQPAVGARLAIRLAVRQFIVLAEGFVLRI